MKSFLKWTGIVLLAAFVVIQFIRPDRENPVSEATRSIWYDSTVPPQVRTILSTSCSDCHSNATTWPWYSNIAPLSWCIASDVEEGREHVNLSKWKEITPAKQAHWAEEIADEVAEGAMPLGYYTACHPSAALDSTQVAMLVAWAKTFDTTAVVTPGTGQK